MSLRNGDKGEDTEKEGTRRERKTGVAMEGRGERGKKERRDCSTASFIGFQTTT